MNTQQIANLINIEISELPDERVWDLLDRSPDKKTKTDDGREIITKKGKPFSHVANVHTILNEDERWQGRLSYNILKDEVCIDEEPLEGHHITKCRLFMQSVYQIKVTKDNAKDLLVLLAKQNTFNPLQDYLKSLKWDGVERLATLLPTYWGTDNTPLICEFGLRWAISCVARAMMPGCKVDTVLILSGPQGALKSSSLQALATDSFFSDSHLDISNKTAYELIHQAGVWIWEIAENYTLQRSDINNSKMFLSAKSDRYRPSYEACPVNRGRSLVFCSTTNEWQMLTDLTGNRRFWPVRVGAIDIEAIKRDRSQIWAEAMHLLSTDEDWWLTGEFELLLSDYQKEFTITDPWQVAVEQVAAHYKAGFINEDVMDFLNMPHSRRTRAEQSRINGICTALKYQRIRKDLEHHAELKRPRGWLKC